MLLRFLLAVLVTCGLHGQTEGTAGSVAEQIGSFVQSAPAVQQGYVGYLFVDASTGAVIAEQNSEKLFTPASNTKLFTTALALERLGPNYRFQTKVAVQGAWSPGQTAVAGLRLIGGGDPNLSGRPLPYQVHAKDGDPLGALKELADAVFRAGIREIDGDVTGVSTRYAGDLYPDGWTIDDAIYGYGAPVTALALNDNTMQVTLHPMKPGQAAGLEVSPPVPELVILNQVATDASSTADVHVERRPGSDEIVLSGRIGKRSAAWEQDFAVTDPALFAAKALVGLLRERGIGVRGSAVSEYAASPAGNGTVIAVHDSAPLSQVIQVVNKVSQNLHAEMLLREVAFTTHSAGTLKAGVAERELFLEQAGITSSERDLLLRDGSGLARQDLVSPRLIVRLLRYMWAQPYRELWTDSLPIGGLDGSLEHRFRQIAGAERIHAKTGSISHVNALSGYLQTASGKWIAFSVIVNGTAAKEAEVRDFIDRMCAVVLPL